jgi:hypothetical protein
MVLLPESGMLVSLFTGPVCDSKHPLWEAKLFIYDWRRKAS